MAISIPIFSSQLEKAREATDLANVRSAYAEVMAAANLDDHESAVYDSSTGKYMVSVQLKQTQKDWQSTVTELGGVEKSDSTHWIGVPQKGGNCVVSYSADDGVVLNWGGYTYQVSTRWTFYGSGKGIGCVLYQNTDTSRYTDVTSVNEPLSGEIGSTVTIKATDDETLKKCQIGIYAVDPETNKILDNTGWLNYSEGASYKISDLSNSGYTGKVKIYVQLYNNRGVSEEVAAKLMQLVSVN